MRLKRIIYIGLFICLFMIFMPNVRAIRVDSDDEFCEHGCYFSAKKNCDSDEDNGLPDGWCWLDTPQHYVGGDTSKVAYCIEHARKNPRGIYENGRKLDYKYFTAEGVKTSTAKTIVKGLQIIFLNGYPYVKPSYLNANEARYATANAIRFWLSEKRHLVEEPRNYDFRFTNLSEFSEQDFIDKYRSSSDIMNLTTIRNKSGQNGKEVLKFATDLLVKARKLESSSIPSHSITFSPSSINMSVINNKYHGETVITLKNISNGYSLDEIKRQLPSGATVSGYTLPKGKSGDRLIIEYPVRADTKDKTYNVTVTGKDNRTTDNIWAYGTSSSSYQVVAIIDETKLIDVTDSVFSLRTKGGIPCPEPPNPVLVEPTPSNRSSGLNCGLNSATTITHNPSRYETGYKRDPSSSEYYCRTQCNSMSLTATFDRKPLNIYAGTGFEYPVKFTGSRTCTFSLNLNTLAEDISKTAEMLSDPKYDQSSPSCIRRRNFYHKLVDSGGILDYCQAESTQPDDSNSLNSNDYNVEQSSSAITAIDDKNETTTYVQSSNSSTDTFSNTNRSSGANIKKCTSAACTSTTTVHIPTAPNNLYNSWSRASTFSTTFALPHVWVDMYTGKLSYSYTAGDKKYDGGNKYYTDFFQATYLNQNDYEKYNFDVSASINADDYTTWDIEDDCSYTLDNRIFPPDNDVHYPNWGNTAFMFRQISLTDPFPNHRRPGTNWVGFESLIKADVYNNAPSYIVANLTPTIMHQIREFNRIYSYTKYDMVDNTGISWFIRKSPYKEIFHITE